jgi:hypothetical protein
MYPACQQPPEFDDGDRRDDLPEDHEPDPAHHQVGQRRVVFKSIDPADLHTSADCGDSPDDGQERPSYRTTEVDDDHRCVGPGDQEVDANVIEQEQHPLAPSLSPSVIEGRSRIEEDHRDPVDRAPRGEHRRRTQLCNHRQTVQADQAQNQTEPVGDGIDQFLNFILDDRFATAEVGPKAATPGPSEGQ